MKSFPLNIFIIPVAILFFLFVLLIHYNLFGNIVHLFNQTNLTKTLNETTYYTSNSKNILTSSITSMSRFEIRNSTSLARIKRFPIFDGGGVVKLVIGTSFPITMANKKRSLSYFYNFQMQYVPPPIPLFWWSFYNTSTFPARKHTHTKKRSTAVELHYDRSRLMLYKYIEAFLQNSGDSNSECLLRVICEISHSPLAEGLKMHEYIVDDIVEDYGRNIYHSLINLIFIPSYPNVDERYITARDAGRNGANCSQTFGECKIVEQLFKQFMRYI